VWAFERGVKDLWSRGIGSKVQGSRFRVEGGGLRVKGSGLRA